MPWCKIIGQEDRCPIRDVAPVREYQSFVDAFLNYVNARSEFAKKKIAEESGLLEDIQLYTKLNNEYNRIINEKLDKGKKRGRRK